MSQRDYNLPLALARKQGNPMDKSQQQIEQEAALLSGLIGGQSATTASAPASYTEPQSPPIPQQRQTQKVTKRHTTAHLPDDLAARAGRPIGLLFAIVVGFGLWLADGTFTLLWLEKMGLTLAGIGYWRWAIPVAITITTLTFWPRPGAGAAHILFWLAVVFFNTGTSGAGLVDWLSDRTIPIFSGAHFPAGSWLHYAMSGAVAIVLAFAPEKIWRWAGGDLVAFWRAVWKP